MALTREYRETVVVRLRKDQRFTAALFAEALMALTEGDKTTTLSIFRDLVHAHITFKRLAEETGFDEKALHRMLSEHGNPTMENLGCLIRSIERDLGLTTSIEAQRVKRTGSPAGTRHVHHSALAYA
jgi:DNA-binding phage protein